MAKKSTEYNQDSKEKNQNPENMDVKDNKEKPSAGETSKSGKKGGGKNNKAQHKEQSLQEEKIAELESRNQEINDKYLRLSAEFDNYRKRTLKEKTDLLKTAGQDIILRILPVVDDFERALQSMDTVEEEDAVKQGIRLIYNKLKEILTQLGLKEIDAREQDFDTDLHEAVTKIPAPDEKLKGKVVDVIEKGYYLNDKVLRFSKVIIGE